MRPKEMHEEHEYLRNNGKTKLEGSYKDGQKDGVWTHLNGRAELLGTNRWYSGNGSITWWHDNGKKAQKGPWKDGKRHGEFTFWHTNGQKRSKGQWTKGKRDGWFTIWSPGGQRGFGVYKGGMPTGTFVLVLGEKLINCEVIGKRRSCLYENGRKASQSDWHDGARTKRTCWNAQGQEIACPD